MTPAVRNAVAMRRQPLAIVATNGHVMSSATATTAKRQMISRTPFIIGRNCSSLVFSFANWVTVDGSISPASVGGGATTILKFAIEQDSPAKTVPITFAGQRTKNLAWPDNDIQSDPLYPAAFGLSQFSRDQKFWIRITAICAASVSFPLVVSGGTGLLSGLYDPANDIDQVDATGVMSMPTGATVFTTFGSVYGPVAILGRPLGPGLSVIAFGDSIGDGTNDTVNPLPTVAGFGFISRATMDAGVASNSIACLKMTRSGATLALFTANPLAMRYLRYANVLLETLLTNDVGTAGTANVTALEAAETSLWSTARAAGVKRILRTKLLPRTTSSNWQNAAGQTYVSGWGVGEAAAQLNAWFDAMVAAGWLDAAPPLNEARDTSVPDALKWVSTGVTNYATTGGLHPQPVLAPLLAVPLRASLLAQIL